MAVIFPKEGDKILSKQEQIKYQTTIRSGPSYPTSSDNFFENRIKSRTGFVTLLKRLLKDCDHFSISVVNI